MKVVRAARFATVVFAVVIVYAFFILAAPLAVASDWMLRSTWLRDNAALWMAGGWLALLAILAWMVMLVTLMYTYLPAHRVASMLQSGLTIISAVLLIGGVIVWMNLLPGAVDADAASLIDGLALTFMGAGLFMGGSVTAWIAVDLGRLEALSWSWVFLGIIAGLLAVPSPFVLPNALSIVLALAFFFAWALFLGVRRSVPSAYPEMQTPINF